MTWLRVGSLPEEPLAAAAAFHAGVLPLIEAELARAPEHFVLIFEPADHRHRGWRLAAVQELARSHAPVRVNALESDDPQAIDAAVSYCAAAPGLTGQLLPLDGNGAGALLSLTQ